MKDKSLNHINKIADAITENIINTLDNEILEEVKEEHGDYEYEANIMRDIISKAKAMTHRPANLHIKEEDISWNVYQEGKQ